MPRLSKTMANQLFTASSRKSQEMSSELEKERLARAAHTAQLRAQRLAKEEVDRAAAAAAKKKPAKKRARPPQSDRTTS